MWLNTKTSFQRYILRYKMKTHGNVKCDVYVWIEIKKSRFFSFLVIWRRLDNVKIKQTSNHIRNAVKYYVQTRYLNGKIHKGSE